MPPDHDGTGAALLPRDYDASALLRTREQRPPRPTMSVPLAALYLSFGLVLSGVFTFIGLPGLAFVLGMLIGCFALLSILLDQAEHDNPHAEADPE